MSNVVHRICCLAITALCFHQANAQTARIGESSPIDLRWELPLRERLNAMASELEEDFHRWTIPQQTVTPESFGAKADGVTLNTKAIQQAIDECSNVGGGTVLLDKGDYVSGTIVLRSKVMLQIGAGSRLLGSTDLKDYPHHVAKRRTVMDSNMGVTQSLIYAEGVEQIGILGPGTIDFRGTQTHFPGDQTVTATPGRPFGIRVIDSKSILVRDVFLKDAACWMQNYLNCERLLFANMRVENHANHNNDGLDIDGCRRVLVRDCIINSEDDALCIKGASMCSTEDVLIENCTIVTTCNALKIGTDTQGDFRRIYARNLKLGGIPDDMRTWKNREASTGITLATVDGGDVEDILIENVEIERTRAPIFLRIGNRGRVLPEMPRPKVGKLHRVVIDKVRGKDNSLQGSLITGLSEPAAFIEDVIIRDMKLGMIGGGGKELISQKVSDDPSSYPDAHQFSPSGLPAYGFTIRSARRIVLDDVSITPLSKEQRPMVHLMGSTEGVHVIPGGSSTR